MYKIGFSLDEFNEMARREKGHLFSNEEVEKLLEKKGFEYKKVIVEEVLKDTIPVCINAIYKNPSSMRIDAPGAFSCSSLISYLYTQAGVWMPSLSIDKYVFGTPIQKEELKFGDLIFSNTSNGMVRTETVEYLPGTKVPDGVDHVGMYVGDNKVLHATKKYEKVLEESMENFKNTSKIVGFRRVADIKEEKFVVSISDDREDLKIKEKFIKNILD